VSPKVYLYACRRRCLIAAFGAAVHDHYDNRSLPRVRPSRCRRPQRRCG
jgi:hypothetical protein